PARPRLHGRRGRVRPEGTVRAVPGAAPDRDRRVGRAAVVRRSGRPAAARRSGRPAAGGGPRRTGGDEMRKVTSLPYKVQEDGNVWTSVPDGVRLAARIRRPSSPGEEPVPAILEFIPCRKRDLTAARDTIHHPYMAGHAYACVRGDIRGTGDSEGVLTD